MNTSMPTGFEPIETAPQDGTVIWVWDPKPDPDYGPDEHPAFWNGTMWEATDEVDTDPFDIDPLGWRRMEHSRGAVGTPPSPNPAQPA